MLDSFILFVVDVDIFLFDDFVFVVFVVLNLDLFC